MGFWSANNNVATVKSLLGLVSNSLSKSECVSGPIIQVRTATKRAAGSRTSMKDSAGRRLGPKKGESEAVIAGEIIMRQRGTKFYPGENVGIGKDHTIFALEAGYVRFYLDPFHPRRRFIGVAISKDAKLPTPHFDPTPRRFGYVPIENPEKAKIEESFLLRKARLLQPALAEQAKVREERREQSLSTYVSQLSNVLPEITSQQAEVAATRLLSIRNHIKNGTSEDLAKATSTVLYLQSIKLAQKRNEITEDDIAKLKKDYSDLSQVLEEKVSFDTEYNIIRYRSEKDRKEAVKQLRINIAELYSKSAKKNAKQIKELIENSNALTAPDSYKFKKAFLPVQTEKAATTDKSKSVVVARRWNYTRGKAEIIART